MCGNGTAFEALTLQLAVEVERGRRLRPWTKAECKIGCGVRSFQVHMVPGKDYASYVVMRTDGTCENFSLR